MCVVSMVMDSRSDDWQRRYWGYISPLAPQPMPYPFPPPAPSVPIPTRQELEEFRRLLERAREYDRKNNEPDCEMDEKRKLLKRLAEALGVSVDFVETTPVKGAS